MGKKKSRPKYVSKGERRSVAGPRLERSPVEAALDKRRALDAGKRVYFTVPNPNPNDTRARFVRVEGRVLYPRRDSGGRRGQSIHGGGARGR